VKLLQESKLVSSITSLSIMQPQDYNDKNADFCKSPRGSISSSEEEDKFENMEEKKVEAKLSKNQRKK
jgi:hypothetical protein